MSRRSKKSAGEGPAQSAGDQVRKPRSVTVTDADWDLIGELAKKCRMSRSEFIVRRSTATPREPAIDLGSIDRRLDRMERVLQQLYQFEAHRLRQHGDDAALERLKRLANEIVDQERGPG